MKKFVADFETIVPADDDPSPETRVWNWGITEIGNPETFDWGTDIDSFMDWCFYRRKNVLVYFHNLRFDGEFIFHWLFENGFTYSEEKEAKTFSTLITKMGQFYAIEIIWDKKIVYEENRKRTIHKKTTFYDSLKKLPFKVEQIAKAFKLPMSKLDIDYKKERPYGYIPTKEEIDYLRNDVQIVAAALHIQFEQELTKMTVASDAMNHFKDLLDDDFKTIFPVLPLNMDAQIRYAYRGGFTYVTPRYAGEDIGEGVVIDRNSMYPAVMYDRPLPHGLPVWFDGKYEHDPTYPLFIQELYCDFQLKPDKIPTIQVKTGRFQENVYLENNIDNKGNNAPVTLFLTNMDMELFFEHYDVTPHYWGGGYKFRQCVGIFRDYIDYWMKVKEENAAEKNAMYTLAKLMLNALYGKFCSNPDVTGKYPYLKEDASIGYKMQDEKVKDPVYTAMGAFITSWARYEIITEAQKLYPRFIYADTDSLHLEGTELPNTLEMHKSKLGAWDHESTFRRARFIRQKTYIEEVDGKLHVTCAGMPDDVKKNVTWENFRPGFSSGGKLLPQHVKGGLFLKDSVFTLKGEREWTQLDMDRLLQKWSKEADYDEIKEGIKLLGYMETVKKGDVFYHEYQELPRSVKMRYFRKKGIAIDVFATELDMGINELFDKLRRK
jgi:hypothetical protein